MYLFTAHPCLLSSRHRMVISYNYLLICRYGFLIYLYTMYTHTHTYDARSPNFFNHVSYIGFYVACSYLRNHPQYILPNNIVRRNERFNVVQTAKFHEWILLHFAHWHLSETCVTVRSVNPPIFVYSFSLTLCPSVTLRDHQVCFPPFTLIITPIIWCYSNSCHCSFHLNSKFHVTTADYITDLASVSSVAALWIRWSCVMNYFEIHRTLTRTNGKFWERAFVVVWFSFRNFIFDISSFSPPPPVLQSLLDLSLFRCGILVSSFSKPWSAAPRFLWDTGSDVFRPKSVPSSPMVKRAFSRLGTITAGWGRSIRKHGSGNTLQSEDRKRWASSQDCSSTYLVSYEGRRSSERNIKDESFFYLAYHEFLSSFVSKYNAYSLNI